MSIHWRKTKQRVEDKIRKAERQEHKLRETKYQKPAPAILIRLTTSAGKLPAGLVYKLPEAIAHALVLRRMAKLVVGSFKVKPDLAFTEAELAHSGLEEMLFPAWHQLQTECPTR